MGRRRASGLARAALLGAVLLAAPARADPGDVPRAGADMPVAFSDLAGWDDDDLALALTTFRRGCAAPADILAYACRDALRSGDLDRADARRFFETAFEPVDATAGGRPGFLTAYYEPEFAGTLEPGPASPTPLLALPTGPADPQVAYPDRAAIEDGALGQLARPLLYLDPVDAFTVQVQGSARIRLPGGEIRRVAYAGRNGLPYTSVGRLLAERLGVPPAGMDANRLTAWLRANPAEARELMRQNRSYIFVRLAPELDPAGGPLGAAGVPLTPGRSVAIDHAAWSYGLPVWLEGSLPEPEGGSRPLARLVIAQDTGAAIVGRTRGDLFVGSGPEAGLRAGLVRQDVRFVVLRPKPPAPKPPTAAP